MNAIMTWLAMHGYGLYLWPAYGLVAGVLGLNAWLVRRLRLSTRRRLQRWMQAS